MLYDTTVSFVSSFSFHILFRQWKNSKAVCDGGKCKSFEMKLLEEIFWNETFAKIEFLESTT